MKKLDGFKKGINLGGWLSQTSDGTKEHFDTFITENDIKTIASWNLDHVRLPVDYNFFQDETGMIFEDNFCYITNCIDWCEKYGLNLLLDLHKTKGYSFDEGENEKGLFENENLITQFIELWEEFAKRYGERKNVAFELLNEVVNPDDNEMWMTVARKATAIIRFYAPEKKILIGGYHNNSVTAIKDLADPFDENIVYSFHCYEPLLFTHQGAYWVSEMDQKFRMKYPVSRKAYFECLEKGVDNAERFSIADAALSGDEFNSRYFENLFSEAMNVAEEREVALYCGEYGVIDLADTESTMNWLKDINATFEKHGIARALWNYKEKDFGLTDKKFDSVRSELIKLL